MATKKKTPAKKAAARPKAGKAGKTTTPCFAIVNKGGFICIKLLCKECKLNVSVTCPSKRPSMFVCKIVNGVIVCKPPIQNGKGTYGKKK